ncbi:unnamed protein product [Amoebophrya sp. A25]|nr:unnamed protein product [Amoebophrya sp. A25]|eukprot:GSA25T00011195001.1
MTKKQERKHALLISEIMTKKDQQGCRTVSSGTSSESVKNGGATATTWGSTSRNSDNAGGPKPNGTSNSSSTTTKEIAIKDDGRRSNNEDTNDSPKRFPVNSEPGARASNKNAGSFITWSQPFVLLEKPQFLVIHKPAYWTCELVFDNKHKTETKSTSSGDVLVNSKNKSAAGGASAGVVRSLANWLQDRKDSLSIEEALFRIENNPALSGDTGFGPLCHRLDRETSGPMLVGKTVRARKLIREEFHRQRVSKCYICLVHGKLGDLGGMFSTHDEPSSSNARSRVLHDGDEHHIAEDRAAATNIKESPSDHDDIFDTTRASHFQVVNDQKNKKKGVTKFVLGSAASTSTSSTSISKKSSVVAKHSPQQHGSASTTAAPVAENTRHGQGSRHLLQGSLTFPIRTVRSATTTRSEVSNAKGAEPARTDYQVLAWYRRKKARFAGFRNDKEQNRRDGTIGALSSIAEVEQGNGQEQDDTTVVVGHQDGPSSSSDLRHDSDEYFSLVACRIHSGRTHQIRVHMQHIGHPLVQDDKYKLLASSSSEGNRDNDDDDDDDAAIFAKQLATGGSGTSVAFNTAAAAPAATSRSNPSGAARSLCPRLFLHSYMLGFKFAGANNNVGRGLQQDRSNYYEVLAVLPGDLKKCLSQLQLVNVAASSIAQFDGVRRVDWQPELIDDIPYYQLQLAVSELVREKGRTSASEVLRLAELNGVLHGEIARAFNYPDLKQGEQEPKIDLALLNQWTAFDAVRLPRKNGQNRSSGVLDGTRTTSNTNIIMGGHDETTTSRDADLELGIVFAASRSELADVRRRKQEAVEREDYALAATLKALEQSLMGTAAERTILAGMNSLEQEQEDSNKRPVSSTVVASAPAPFQVNKTNETSSSTSSTQPSTSGSSFRTVVDVIKESADSDSHDVVIASMTKTVVGDAKKGPPRGNDAPNAKDLEAFPTLGSTLSAKPPAKANTKRAPPKRDGIKDQGNPSASSSSASRPDTIAKQGWWGPAPEQQPSSFSLANSHQGNFKALTLEPTPAETVLGKQSGQSKRAGSGLAAVSSKTAGKPNKKSNSLNMTAGTTSAKRDDQGEKPVRYTSSGPLSSGAADDLDLRADPSIKTTDDDKKASEITQGSTLKPMLNYISTSYSTGAEAGIVPLRPSSSIGVRPPNSSSATTTSATGDPESIFPKRVLVSQMPRGGRRAFMNYERQATTFSPTERKNKPAAVELVPGSASSGIKKNNEQLEGFPVPPRPDINVDANVPEQNHEDGGKNACASTSQQQSRQVKPASKNSGGRYLPAKRRSVAEWCDLFSERIHQEHLDSAEVPGEKVEHAELEHQHGRNGKSSTSTSRSSNNVSLEKLCELVPEFGKQMQSPGPLELQALIRTFLNSQKSRFRVVTVNNTTSTTQVQVAGAGPAGLGQASSGAAREASKQYFVSLILPKSASTAMEGAGDSKNKNAR